MSTKSQGGFVGGTSAYMMCTLQIMSEHLHWRGGRSMKVSVGCGHTFHSLLQGDRPPESVSEEFCLLRLHEHK